MAIEDFPLVAVTELLNAPCVDNRTNRQEYFDPALLGTIDDIAERKLREVRDRNYDWTVDTKWNYPIHFFHWEPGKDAYGHTLDSSMTPGMMVGNGHHRLAFQAFVQGALFVHVSDNKRDCDKSWY